MLLFLSGRPAFSQASPEVLPIPESILYRTLFMHVIKLEQFGDRLDAQKKSSDYIRSLTRREAQLTLAEDSLLKSIAKDWYSANSSLANQSMQIHRSSLNNSGQALDDPVKRAKFKAVAVQQTTVLTDHITQLKNGLGPDRFGVLDAFVRSSIAPRITYTRVKASPAKK